MDDLECIEDGQTCLGDSAADINGHMVLSYGRFTDSVHKEPESSKHSAQYFGCAPMCVQSSQEARGHDHHGGICIADAYTCCSCVKSGGEHEYSTGIACNAGHCPDLFEGEGDKLSVVLMVLDDIDVNVQQDWCTTLCELKWVCTQWTYEEHVPSAEVPLYLKRVPDPILFS